MNIPPTNIEEFALGEAATSDAILIVDDIADNCDLLDRYLRRSGYTTQICGSGTEAIAVVSRVRPQLILLDWMMPGLSGLDTLYSIRELYDETVLPIIMCTAIDEDISVVNALRAGANDYITKPINMSVMLARVESQLQRVARVQALSSDKHDLEKALTERTAALLRASRSNNSGETL